MGILTSKQKGTLAKDKPKSKNQYVDNQEFLELILAYKLKCKEAKSVGESKPKIPEKIGQILLSIAKNMLTKSWFSGYTQNYKEEMLGDALENCLTYFDNFDPEVGTNPFAYYSQICYYAFKRRIEREKKQTYTKYKMMQQSGVLTNGVEQPEEGQDEFQQDVHIFVNIDEFISKYEDEIEKERARIKEGKKNQEMLKNESSNGTD